MHEWKPEGNEDDPIPSASSAVHQAVGAGSVCWENMVGTGVFNEEQARAISEGLLKFLHDHHGLRLPITRPEGHGWQPLDGGKS